MRRFQWFVVVLGMTLVISINPGNIQAAEGDEGFVAADASGNDPRDFGSKFLPYYNYMELENDIEVNSFTLFGFFAFNSRFGLTYELPLAQEIDYSDVEGFQNLIGDVPNIGPDPGAGGGGTV